MIHEVLLLLWLTAVHVGVEYGRRLRVLMQRCYVSGSGRARESACTVLVDALCGSSRAGKKKKSSL